MDVTTTDFSQPNFEELLDIPLAVSSVVSGTSLPLEGSSALNLPLVHSPLNTVTPLSQVVVKPWSPPELDNASETHFSLHSLPRPLPLLAPPLPSLMLLDFPVLSPPGRISMGSCKPRMSVSPPPKSSELRSCGNEPAPPNPTLSAKLQGV